MTLPRTLEAFAFWSVVIVVMATPSYLLAPQEYSRLGMACGVLTYVALYTAFSLTQTFARFTARRFVARTLRIGYITWMAVSLIFPAGLIVDAVPGILVAYWVGDYFLDESAFPCAYAATLLQGGFVHLPVAIYLLLVYRIQVAIERIRTAPPPPPPSLLCPNCDYDLRATPDRCPECGHPVPPGHQPTIGAA